MPSGLFIPDGPPRNLKVGPGLGWGAPDPPGKRKFVGPGKAPNPDVRGWTEADIDQHVKGRAEATAAVLLGVALLKKLNLIGSFQQVRYTKAVWQDWSGNEQNPRAHRIPCNPTIAYRNIPDIPKGIPLQQALIKPLAKTDFLDLVVNHVDSRFEALGAKESLAEAVRFVVKEQGEGKPVNRDVLHYAAVNVAKAGYQKACTAVHSEVMQEINGEGYSQMMERNQYWIDKPLAPTGNLEQILEVASVYELYTARCEPKLLAAGPLGQEAQRLESLAKES